MNKVSCKFYFTFSSIPLVGIDCYGMDRDVLNDFAKYYNNAHLSDLTLVVGEEMLV